MYILQSNIDYQNFYVDQKVIDASVLLKNLYDLTEITEPIILECSSQCLDIYIKIINHYSAITESHDTQFEIDLFKDITDQRLSELVKEFAYLDSDFFTDSVADVILDRIKEMSWKEMQQYFGLENDYTFSELNRIEKFRLEHLISLRTKKFYIPSGNNNTSVLTLENKFYTPMNVIFQRIIQRSNDVAAFKLSMINKTIKAEIDKYPIKVGEFIGGNRWVLTVGNFSTVLTEKTNKKYFNAIKKRKILPCSEIRMCFDHHVQPKEKALHSSSLDFAVPERIKILTVNFSQANNQIFQFDILQCPFPSIFYDLSRIQLSFDVFYEQLIVKDLSKEIKIHSSKVFDFFADEFVEILKKPNAAKFHEIFVALVTSTTISEKFKDFITNYMEDDAIIKTRYILFDLPSAFNAAATLHLYRVSEIKQFL